MTLQQLKYLVEISKCGSISLAAQNLFIAQPSLSKSIKELETEFGVTLLERNRHGVSFTVEGMEFLGYATRILEQAGSLKEHFSHSTSAEDTIHLTISSQHYMFVVDALISFMKHIGNSHQYTLSIREGRTSQVIQDVLVQQSQIGIIYVSNVTQSFMNRLFQKSGLEFIPFREFPPYVYLNRQHPLAGQESLTIEDLAPYPYVRYEQGVDPYQYSEEIIIPEATAGKTVFVTDRSTMLSIISNTHAYNIGTGCLFSHIVGDQIISLPLRNRIDLMKIGWLKLKNKTMSPPLTEYVNLLTKSLQKCN